MDNEAKHYVDTLAIGTTLQGKTYCYRIERVLGQGTFGITYLASTRVKVSGMLGEIDTTVKVAVKEFFMKDVNGREESTVTSGSKGGLFADYKKKFSREAANLSRLRHPHIVKVLETFKANGTVYYAMEYCEGGSLNERTEARGGLPEEEAVGYARQIGEALSYMHVHKMLHLDVKPGNVLLRENGEAVLIDFGLSKQYDEEGLPESSTSVGGGTPGYAPIEQSQYREGKEFPVTMDVYALGATLFKLLTGERPPESAVVLNEGLPAEALRRRKVSETTVACVEKAMSPMKKDRYPSVDAMLAALDDTGEGSSSTNEETDLDEEKKMPSDKRPQDTKETEETTSLDNEPIKEKPAERKKSGVRTWTGVGFVVLVVIALLLWNRHERETATAYQLEQERQNSLRQAEEARRASELAEQRRWAQQAEEARKAKEARRARELAEQREQAQQDSLRRVEEARKAEEARRARELAEQREQARQDSLRRVEEARKAEEARRARESNQVYQFERGLEYYNKGNYTEAIKWWRKAAEQGNAAAQCNLGFCYDKGHGVAQDYAEAVKWYRKAAEQGEVTAQCNLGWCYSNGHGVAQDYAEAVKWYRKAAEQGDSNAQYYLGVCYYYGQGVAQDKDEAIKWWRKAADQRNSMARDALERRGLL